MDSATYTPSNEPSPNWGNEFAEFISTSLHIEKEFEVRIENGNRVVEDPPAEIYDEGEKLWTHCLVGQFLGEPPPYYHIGNMVEMAWWKFGNVEIINKGRGLYIFKFKKEEHCQKVLHQLWHVNNRPLLLRKWKPNLEYVNSSCKKVPIWVKLRDVPMSLWSKRGLGYVASFVGTPLQMDAMTETRRNLFFLRGK